MNFESKRERRAFFRDAYKKACQEPLKPKLNRKKANPKKGTPDTRRARQRRFGIYNEG